MSKLQGPCYIFLIFSLVQCSEIDTTLPTVQYNFIPIAKVEGIEPNALIGNCIVIVLHNLLYMYLVTVIDSLCTCTLHNTNYRIHHRFSVS